MKTAVIVNEFGEVGIDGDILRGKNIDVVELNSGCLCCTLRGSLMLAVEELRDKAKVERVIVEATGVAQPGELLETLADSSLDGGLDIGPLVTVVDVAKFPKLLSMLGDFYSDQIENADILVVNKTDLVSRAELDAAAAELHELNPKAQLVFTEQGRVEPQRLFEKRGDGVIEQARAAMHDDDHEDDDSANEAAHHDHDHEHDPHEDAPAQSFVVPAPANAERAGLESFFRGLPDNVWRAKGFMHIGGAPCLVQYSLGQLEITPADGRTDGSIVFIGQGMDRADIKSRFARAMKP
jgi:G3E family GTPase